MRLSRVQGVYKYKRFALSVLLAIMAVSWVSAQEQLTVFVGETRSYFVENHAENEYLWSVYNDQGFSSPASESEALFVESKFISDTKIRWLQTGWYYIIVTETDISGCKNSKAMAVNVLPSDRSVGFEETFSSACFDSGGNGFAFELTALDSNGQSLNNSYFPLEVQFTVDGEDHSAFVKFDSQFLEINEEWFEIGPELETSITIELGNVADKDGIPLFVRDTVHVHTVYSLPEIQFANTLPDTIALYTSHSFNVMPESNFTYSWWFEDESGNRTYFNSNNGSTEEYFWDNAGEYQLFVQSKNENGCLSEISSKIFIVEENDSQIPLLVALPDVNVGYENSLITGDVSINDYLFFTENPGLIYSLQGDPVEGLVFFDNGTYEYQPPQGFYGKITFTYQVCTEGLPQVCATSEVKIRVLSSASTENIAPVASADVALTHPNRAVSSNLLVNDIDPDGFGIPLIVNVQPVVEPSNGEVTIEANGNFTYTPAENFEGIDRFMYKICDQGTEVACDSAWVFIIVSELVDETDNPVIVSDYTYQSTGEIHASLSENIFILEGRNFVYNITPVISVENGALQLFENGDFIYTPNPGFFGNDYFIYEVCYTNAEQETVCRKVTASIIIYNEEFTAEGLAGNDTVVGQCTPFVLGTQQIGNKGFTYLWEPSDDLDDPSKANPVFTPGNSTNFILTIIDDSGKTDTDTVLVTVSKVLANAGNQVYMFEGEQTVLDGLASEGTEIQYLWTTTNGKIESGENSANPVVSNFGTYILQVTDKFGCSDSDTVNVGMITNAPVAVNDYDTTNFETAVKIDVLQNDFDPENDIDSLSLAIKIPPLNGSAAVDYSDFTINYQPNENFSGSDEFTYQICDSFDNCADANVFVLVLESRFFIPDAFSPNNDGINDYFEIIGIDRYQGNSLEIFNRWGNRVYRAENYGISASPLYWDGKSNTGFKLGDDELPTGTYFYVLNLGNGEKRIVGSVYLDR